MSEKLTPKQREVNRVVEALTRLSGSISYVRERA